MEMRLHSPVTLTSAFLITLVWGISLYGGFTRAPGPWAGPKLEGVVWGALATTTRQWPGAVRLA